MATSSNRVKSRIGVNTVAATVENLWECGWQEYAAQNDDAVDGVILMRRGNKKPADTGGLVFVQIKCGGEGYRRDIASAPDHIGVALGGEHIETHRPRWARVPGPMTLVYVDDTVDRANPPAWWTNLRDPSSFSSTNAGLILIPRGQRFSHHSKGDFHRLCGTGPHDRPLRRIELTRTESLIPCLGKTESLRNDAWSYYKAWREDFDACVNPSLGPVLVNRVGWKHMTRQGRLPERIVQSWLLLGAARRIVTLCDDFYQLGRAEVETLPDGNKNTVDYLGLRAAVSFPYRHAAVVQVVLKRSRLVQAGDHPYEREKIWFYSVYELRRGAPLA